MTLKDLFILFLQLAVLLTAAYLSAQAARRLKQPAVLGELIGGIILGPTIFGALAPDIYHYIFKISGAATGWREGIVKLGLLVFLFAAGLETNLRQLRNEQRTVMGASGLGIIVPFAVGISAVYLFPSLWGEQANQSRNLFAIFLGTALSISALPVIARILSDLNLIKTKFGATVMASATLNDLVGWGLFALIVESQMGSQFDWASHVIIFAFLAGAVIAALDKRVQEHHAVFRFIKHFIVPVYFVSIGLKVNFITYFDWTLVSVVILIACLGKIVGVTGGALWGKLPFREALAVGFAMNARGAMEIILASIALEHKLIDERIFVALFIMALVTSMMSGPALKILLKK